MSLVLVILTILYFSLACLASSPQQQLRNVNLFLLPSFQKSSAPSSSPILSIPKSESRGRKSVGPSPNLKRVESTEQSPFKGLANFARGGLLDLRSSALQIASSKSSSELIDNVVGALLRHKAITVTGIAALYYFTHRSLPDPVSNAREAMSRQQARELSKWGSKTLPR